MSEMKIEFFLYYLIMSSETDKVFEIVLPTILAKCNIIEKVINYSKNNILLAKKKKLLYCKATIELIKDEAINNFELYSCIIENSIIFNRSYSLCKDLRLVLYKHEDNITYISDIVNNLFIALNELSKNICFSNIFLSINVNKDTLEFRKFNITLLSIMNYFELIECSTNHIEKIVVLSYNEYKYNKIIIQKLSYCIGKILYLCRTKDIYYDGIMSYIRTLNNEYITFYKDNTKFSDIMETIDIILHLME